MNKGEHEEKYSKGAAERGAEGTRKSQFSAGDSEIAAKAHHPYILMGPH